MRYLIILLLLVASVFAQDMTIRSVQFEEVVNPGDNIEVFASIGNVGDSMLDDVYIVVDSPEMDVFYITEAKDVDNGEAESYLFDMDIPGYLPAGDYALRFAVFGEDEYRLFYRYIILQ